MGSLSLHKQSLQPANLWNAIQWDNPLKEVLASNLDGFWMRTWGKKTHTSLSLSNRALTKKDDGVVFWTDRDFEKTDASNW